MRRIHAVPLLSTIALLAAGCGEDATTDAPDASDDAATGDARDGGAEERAPDVAASDAREDDAPADAPADAVVDADAHPDADAAACARMSCDEADPATCAAGRCIDGLCDPAIVPPHLWDACGDGACDACEDARSCPADCGAAPAVAARAYDDPNTITVWVHGFNNNSAADLKSQVYGSVKGCGDLGDIAAEYGEARPCGDAQPTAPNQLVGVEYYGATPPDWMTPADVAEIERYPYLGGPTGLQRYARVVAKFIRHRMALSGAAHVNLTCHSMGCLLSRFVIENDLEQLASQGVISRWIGCAGVVGGAQLARLYAINPIIQQTADLVGLAVDDFALMNPDYVQEYAAPWDHRLWSADNPLYAGILMHHMGATDPRIPQAANIQLLDLFNPGNAPNDGIMFTLDEHFHDTGPLARTHTPSGVDMPATRSYVYVGHMEASSDPGFRAIAAAGLFHRRKVIVTLSSLTLHDDREFSLSETGEQGLSPGEIAVETKVRYDPYTQPAFGRKALVHDDEIAYRSPDLWSQSAGTTDTRGVVLFEGPIFDAQTSLQLDVAIDEVDLYPRWGVNEALFATPNRELATYSGEVTLADQTLQVSTGRAEATIAVKVVPMY